MITADTIRALSRMIRQMAAASGAEQARLLSDATDVLAAAMHPLGRSGATDLLRIVMGVERQGAKRIPLSALRFNGPDGFPFLVLSERGSSLRAGMTVSDPLMSDTLAVLHGIPGTPPGFPAALASSFRFKSEVAGGKYYRKVTTPSEAINDVLGDTGGVFRRWGLPNYMDRLVFGMQRVHFDVITLD